MEWHKTVDGPLQMQPICICEGPATSFATRQGPSVVAECAEADCRRKWYHLDCLDSPDQEKAREGTFVCEICLLWEEEEEEDDDEDDDEDEDEEEDEEEEEEEEEEEDSL